MLLDCAGSWNSLVDLFRVRRARHADCESERGADSYDVELAPDVDRFPSASQAEGGIEVLQQSGELLVFPGSWWHQTYSEEESWAVCAQYLKPNNLDSVLRHICDWCGIDMLGPANEEQGKATSRIDAVLEEVFEAQGDGVFPCMTGSEVLAHLRAFDRAVPIVSSDNMQSLSTDHLVSLLWGSAALGCGQQSVWRALCSEVPRQSRLLAPSQLVTACWALARVHGPRCCAAELSAASRLAAETAAQVESLTMPQLATAAWALARLPLPPAAAVVDEAAYRLCELLPKQLGYAAWAVAPSSGARAGAALRTPAVPELDRRGLLGTLWALAELTAGWSPLTEAVLQRPALRLHESTPWALAPTAWAVATAVMRDEGDGHPSVSGQPLVSALAAEAARRTGALPARHLARVSWAFAVLSMPHAPLYGAVATQAAARTREFDPGSLAAITWALATLGVRESTLLTRAWLQALRLQHEFAPRDLAAVPWSFEQLAWRGSEPLLVSSLEGRGAFHGLLILEPEGC